MLASLAQMLIGRTAPAGMGGRLSVLVYHRVLAQPDPLLPSEPCASQFEQTMRWVKRVFNVIPLSEGVAGLKTGRLPARALCITFDDGYANNESIAAPILARLGLHATFFIATGYLDGGRMFNDTVVETVRGFRGNELDLESLGLGRYPVRDVQERVQAIAVLLESIRERPPAERIEVTESAAQAAGVTPTDDLMMSSTQAAKLARMGFALGAHTISHPMLARLSAEEARREIVASKRRVEQLTENRTGLFAYPNGRPNRDYDAATVELVRAAGFDGAVTTSRGAARIGSDRYQIPRFTPWDQRTPAFAVRMWSNLARVEPAYAAA